MAGYSSLFTAGLRRVDPVDVPVQHNHRSAQGHQHHILDGVSIIDPNTHAVIPYATHHLSRNNTAASSTLAVKSKTRRSSPRRSSWSTSAPHDPNASYAPSFATEHSLPISGDYRSADTRSVNSAKSRGYASTLAGALPSGSSLAPDNASFVSFKSSRSSKRSSFTPAFVDKKKPKSPLTVETSPTSSRYYSMAPPTPPPHSALPSVPAGLGYTNNYRNNHDTNLHQQYPVNHTSNSRGHHRQPSNANSAKSKRRAKGTSLSFLSMSDSPLEVIPEPGPDLRRRAHNRPRHPPYEEEEQESGESSPDTIIMQYPSPMTPTTPTPTTTTATMSSIQFAQPNIGYSPQSPISQHSANYSYPQIQTHLHPYQKNSDRYDSPTAGRPPSSSQHPFTPKPAAKLSRNASATSRSTTKSKTSTGGGAGGLLQRLFSFSSKGQSKPPR